MASKSHPRPAHPREPRTPAPQPQRPKLMRAAATAPSLAISVASRKDCSAYAHPASAASGASSLLSRMANSSAAARARGSPRPDDASSSSSSSNPGSVVSSPESSPNGHSTRPPHAYFSFPSFEEFHHQYAHQDDNNVKPD